MPRTYVDNSYNRSIGRVGMPVGSMVVSRGTSSSSSSFSSPTAFVSNASSSGFGSSSGSSTRTYVDNAYNRNIGRVGMSVGSMVVSRGASGTSSASGSSFGSNSGSGRSTSTYVDNALGSSFGSSSDRTTKNYVDNANNRKVGRAGLPVGSMVMTKDNSVKSNSKSTSTEPTGKTYVDNAYNRKHERVGKEIGTAAISKEESSSKSSSRNTSTKSSVKTYVDNAYNRKHERVGKEIGTAVISKKESSGTGNSDSSSAESSFKKTYVDNAYNRKLGRVGKEIGTAPVSKTEPGEVKRYKDNAFNRRVGRVGKIIGTHVIRRKKPAKSTNEVLPSSPNFSFFDDLHYGEEELFNLLPEPRRNEELWYDEQNKQLETMLSKQGASIYFSDEINADELEFEEKIGEGGFSEVYVAMFRGCHVAVKKLKVQKVSKRRLADFKHEVTTFCNLNHPNIVQFIGPCLDPPNLCIVMELMETSLFDVLHASDEDEISLSDLERLTIIQQICSGLEYLHSKGIAHCDIKSQNILIDYEAGIKCRAKITDFGLSMMKSNTETSTTGRDEHVCNVGTPRYSAPEVLRGEMLSAKAMFKADVYSLGLILYEIIYEAEPFYDLNYAQLRKQIGEKGRLPDIPSEPMANPDVDSTMRHCLVFDPDQRAGVTEVKDFFIKHRKLYF